MEKSKVSPFTLKFENEEQFKPLYSKAVSTLTKSEAITREGIRVLSREVLKAHHATENVDYINRLIGAVTPVNRKMLVIFFKEFSGFHYDDENLKLFTKKARKGYDDAKATALRRLEDPLFNAWSFAEAHIEVEKTKKPLLESVEASAKRWHARAKAEGLTDADILAALFKGGIDATAVVKALDMAGYEMQ